METTVPIRPRSLPRALIALVVLCVAGPHAAVVAEEPVGSTLTGMVVDAGEKPVSGIVVRATRVELVPPHAYEDRSGLEYLFARRGDGFWIPYEGHATTSDAKGGFRLAGLRPGARYVVQAGERQDVASKIAVARAGSEAGSALRLVVERGHVVRLRLVDEAGAGVRAQISAALVPRVCPWHAGAVRWGLLSHWGIESAADGRARIAVPDGEGLAISAAVAGRFVATGILVDTTSDAEQVVRLGADPGVAVGGSVVDGSAEPVPGAMVSIEVLRPGTTAPFEQRFRGVARTDALGRYRIEHLPAGRIDRIGVDAAGFLFRQHYQVPFEGVAGDTLEVDLGLERVSVLTGRVTDDAGMPVEGALVSVRAGWQGGRSWHTSAEVATATDADGRYRLEGLAVGESEVTVSKPGFGSPTIAGTALKVVVLAVATEVTQDVALTRRVPVRGRVLDARAAPRAGVELLAYVTPRSPRPESLRLSEQLRARSGVDGVFEFPGLPAGVEMGLRVDDRSGRGETIVRIDVDAPVEDVVVTWGPPQRILGRVVDLEGRPVPGVAVHRSGTSAAYPTDATGRFEIADGLRPGPVRLALGPDVHGGHALELEVAPGETLEDIELVHPGTGVISGTVRIGDQTPRFGTPVALSIGDGGAAVSTVTDPRGRFRFTRLLPGSYRLHVAGRPWGDQGDLIVPGGEPLDVLYTPDVEHVLRGSVRLPDGQLVPRGTLRVRAGERDHPVSAPIFGGAFRVALASGADVVEVAVAEALAIDGTQISVLSAPGEFAIQGGPVEIVLQPGHGIAGRLVDEDAGPVAGARVHLMSGYRPWWWLPRQLSQRTGPDGSFRFLGLVDARYQVRVIAGGDWAPVAPVEMVPGRVPTVIEVPAARVLEGRLTSEDGVPLSDAQVWITLTAPEWLVQSAPVRQPVTTGADGRFEVGGWPPDATFDVEAGWVRREHGWYFGRAIQGVTLVEPFVVELERGVRITGTLTTREGEAAPGVRIEAKAWYIDQPLPTSSVQMGPGQTAFELGPLRRGGRYRLALIAPIDFDSTFAVAVDAPAEDIEIRVTRMHPVRGRVIPADRARSATARFLYVDPETGARKSVSGRLRANAFEIENGLDVRGAIYVTARDGFAALLEDVRPSDGPFVLEFGPTATIEGRIEGLPESLGPHGLEVRAVRGHFVHKAKPGSDGAFKLGPLPNGPYRIEVDTARIRGRFEGPGIVAAGTTDVRLRYVIR